MQKIKLIPKIDIVLNDGRYLRRGAEEEIEISDDDISSIAQYITIIEKYSEKKAEPQAKQQAQKKARQEVKNGLDR